jgi:hypothetical protein
MMTNSKTSQSAQPRRPWQAPVVTLRGTLGELVREGTGKVSVIAGDPGEPRKPAGGNDR